jgi:Rho-binding antiterminator
MEEYQPISCSFYDRLEEAATIARVVKLKYFEKAELIEVRDKINTFKIRNKVEYLILDSGQEIRLDKIDSLDDIELKNHC